MLTPDEQAALTRALERAHNEGVAVGRTVHYHSLGSADGQYKSEPRAAIITETGRMVTHGTNDGWKPVVSLAVLNPTGLFFAADIAHSPTPKPGHWSWPPRN